MTDASVIRRLATSQARGTRQLSLVNELLTFDAVSVQADRIPQWRNGQQLTAVSYGETRLGHSSFLPLRNRLIEAGFILVVNRERTQVTMTFPEG